ncbi:MAG: hypothetical protein EXR72_24480 [Myxococcales bacterium]|nr:hypothetical protein [Myxococcales bacterium]
MPAAPPAPSRSSWRRAPETIRALFGEYFSLRQLPALLRSRSFWMPDPAHGGTARRAALCASCIFVARRDDFPE